MQANHFLERKNMELILIKIQSCLQKTKVWRFVCFFSSVVGLLCYAFSSSFNHLYGNWTWWKILLYIVFSFIVSLAVLFAKPWECSTSRLEAHMAFVILMITSIYSFFFDKQVKGKPDAYSLVSSAAFAVMSLALARLSHFGFEVDLLYFFSGVLTVQLMKIKLWLVIVGGSFTYSLIILRSTLVAPRSRYGGIQDQDHVVLEVGSHLQSQGTRISPITTQVDSPQPIVTMAQEADSPPENKDQGLLISQPEEDNSETDKSSIVAKFMGCIETLKKENGKLILTILKHVNEYFKADLVIEDHDIQLPKLHQDDNLVVDSLPSGIINDLAQSIRLMMRVGLEDECLQVYRTCRWEFLNEILSALKEFNMKDIDEVTKMRHSVKALLVAHKILLPNERTLNERIFHWFFRGQVLYPASSGRAMLRFWKSIGIETPIETVTSSRRFIQLFAKQYGLKPIFKDNWLRKNKTEFQQKLELYRRSSWNKILNILKLDINESEPNVAAELMKKKLISFNEHFDDICNVQVTWFVLNEELRKQIVKSIENMLLPAYGNFIARFQDFLGNHAYKYIKHGMFDVQDRLNNLFLVRK